MMRSVHEPVYASFTTRLRKVTGSADQYTYDQNGNMTSDEINRNKNIKYDHRNLITELRHKELVHEDSIVYVTYYNYDEAGNRISKTVYRYTDSSEPSDTLSEEDVSISSSWELYKAEIYSRDVSGRELAVYKDNAIEEYPIYGLDMIGKLKNDIPYYYYKDHLGSVRAVVNANNELVSAQDYDQWGYILQGRTYESDDSKFKFTGKERDEENRYDYFGARYYDARVGRWGQTDPLQDKEPSKTPYHYTSNNPISFVDPFGLTDYYYKDGEETDRQPGEYAWMYSFGFKTDIFDRYYVQDPSGNVEYNGNMYFQGATKESVLPIEQQQIQWSKIYADWETTGFASNVNSALELYQAVKDEYISVLDYALKQSGEKGQLDRKHHLINYEDSYSAQSYLYIYKGFAFNWRQAGNIVWGASMKSLGFNYKGIFTGAQFYSLFKHDSFDQPDEVYSFKVGYYRSTSPWRHLGQ